MGTRVKEILSWYASENPGVRTNLARMLNHGTLAGTGRWSSCPSTRASSTVRRGASR